MSKKTACIFLGHPIKFRIPNTWYNFPGLIGDIEVFFGIECVLPLTLHWLNIVGSELWGECAQQKPWDAESFTNTWNNLQVTLWTHLVFLDTLSAFSLGMVGLSISLVSVILTKHPSPDPKNKSQMKFKLDFCQNIVQLTWTDFFYISTIINYWLFYWLFTIYLT